MPNDNQLERTQSVHGVDTGSEHDAPRSSSKRRDFEVHRRARSDEEPQRVEQRSEDGDHDKSVSKNGGNLKGRNRYGVSGRDRRGVDQITDASVPMA
jgi:hypothetical protein